MKICFVLIAALLISISVNGQSGRHDGFLITNEGVRIEGSFLVEKDSKMIKSIKLKPYGEDKYRTFNASETQSYELAGKVFESLAVDGKKVFLRLLVQGSLSLYSYKPSSNGLQYFLKTEDSEVNHLQNSVTTVEREGKSYKREGKEYVSILKNSADDPQFDYAISECKLETESLVVLVNTINESRSSEKSSVIYYMKPGKTFQKGIYFGGSKYLMNKSDLYLQTGFVLGIKSKDISTRFAFNIGAYYIFDINGNQEDVDYNFHFPVYGSLYLINNRKINLSLDAGIMFMLYIGKDYNHFDPSVNLGLSLDINMGKDIVRFRSDIVAGYFNFGAGYVF